MPEPIRLVCLVSGGGTTLQNLLDRIADGRLNARVVGVVSSRADAFGVERAERVGVPCAIVPSRQAASHKSGADNTADLGPDDSRLATFPERVWDAVRAFAPDLVCFAGWLHLLPIPADFRHRVLNIHPSLLPAFGGKGMYGRHVHEEVLRYGAKVSGCTVHFADDTYDTGPILVQRAVPVLEDDTPDSLAARVFAAECEAYPEAIRLIAEGRATVAGRRVVIRG
ncbi:MAG: phosphoribosylglycinamide formyltransferase [Gemmataceae bacterium]|nr:phosphoribosylglycinamide formyltransferase [Gemmataceae bacterium]